jgi:hypothetical protein
MSNWENEPEKNSGLSEIEQMQLDAIIMDTAFKNSYLVLTNQITFDELIATKFDIGHEAVMAYDPEQGPTYEQLDNMIHHFIDHEEYEKCAKIQKIIDATFPQNKE